MFYLSDDRFSALTERLLEASQHCQDPRSEIQISLADFDVMPEAARPDAEVNNRANGALNVAKAMAEKAQDWREGLAVIDRLHGDRRPYGAPTTVIHIDTDAGEVVLVN